MNTSQLHLTRRQLLKTSGIALAGAGFTVQSLPAAAQKRPGMKKALMFGMVKTEGTLLEKFRMLKEVGYDGVELDSPGFDVKEVLKARDATGLQICGVVDSVHWKQTLSDPDPAVRAAGLEGLKTAIRECKMYGGSSVLLVPAVVKKEVSYADAYARSQAEIRKALPLAEELGVKIAVENVWNQFLLSPLEAARYVDEFKSPWIGWHLDIGNLITFGWPEHWIQVLGKRILKLHIKEFSRKKRDEEGLRAGFNVNLWEGDCDWPAVMKALDQVGFRGWGSAELAGGGPERLRDIAERMDRIYES
ncbi:MAG: sugar phosphate isomerase/epimerase [Acidobacteria bacterium]|nr:sugar phosphate isomerase/epimerase [Acidobacteriota bacterium]